jgi:protein-L-isoaspartate(D-aspartate) O-methyltransferase
VAGQGSQALQGFAVDGRKVHEIDVSFWIRLENVKPGPETDQLPMLVITFYDERRGVAAHRPMGPWRGSFDWRKEQERIRVPTQAREAIVRIGLFGATGRADFDDVRISAAEADARRQTVVGSR